MAKQTLKLGPVQVTQGSDTPMRAAIMIWGPSSAGKSTFAATAPGDKLWLSFGDQEHTPVMHRKDVHVAKLYDLSVDDLFKQVQNDNPLDLDKFFSENENIATCVCDSLTALTFRALQKSVKNKVGGSNTFTPTMEAPGQSAYGGRNAIVLECLTGLLRVTAKHNVHLIITAHEADPTMGKGRDSDVIQHIGIMLGGQLVNNTTYRLSDIWYMSQSDTGEKNRRIAIRNTRLRRPMKTRTFVNNDKPEFEIDYDPDKPDKGQMTIASWIDEFMETGRRLPIPQIKGRK